MKSPSGKIRYRVSRLIGDRIKMDILLILEYPFGLNEENRDKIAECRKRLGLQTENVVFVPTYSALLTCIYASSSVLLKKLDELEKDGLITSTREPDKHNRRIFYLTPLGKKISQMLFKIEIIIEEGDSENYS